MVGVQADNATAEDRDRFGRSLQEAVESRYDGILLSTCHRVEAYGFGPPPQLNVPLPVKTGEGAARHLIRVAAGLESAIVGEDEVLYQVRQALATARASRPVDTRLIRLFETAIAAGRRARAGRTAACGNLAQRAMAWLRQWSELKGRMVLIVGAGRMGSALAHAAKVEGAEVVIASRNEQRAQRLASVYAGRGVDLDTGARLACESAGIAIALAGAWREFEPADIKLPPIADISAPPVVSASIRARLKGGFLGIDDLYARNQNVPAGFIQNAERITDAKTLEFVTWLGRGS